LQTLFFSLDTEYITQTNNYKACTSKSTSKGVDVIKWRVDLVQPIENCMPDFSKFLGTAEGLRKPTKWVMQRGILGLFRGARNAFYGHLLALSPVQY
jgi:hypothetical protein